MTLICTHLCLITLCVCVYTFPGAAVMLAELAVEAGLPNGVLNIVHGNNVRLLIIVYQILFTPLIPCLSMGMCNWSLIFTLKPSVFPIEYVTKLSTSVWSTMPYDEHGFIFVLNQNCLILMLLWCYLPYHKWIFFLLFLSSFSFSLSSHWLGTGNC